MFTITSRTGIIRTTRQLVSVKATTLLKNYSYKWRHFKHEVTKGTATPPDWDVVGNSNAGYHAAGFFPAFSHQVSPNSVFLYPFTSEWEEEL